MTGRLVLLSTGLDRGGAEAQVVALARELRRRKWGISVISLLPTPGIGGELARAGIQVFSLGMRPGVPSVTAAARFAGLLRTLRPHVLHAHLFHANLLARAVRPLCNIPAVVSTIHSMAESGRESQNVSRRDRIYRLTDGLCDVTTCVCSAAAQRHVEGGAVPSSKVRVIPNGLEIARFRADAAARKRIRRELGLGNEFVWLAVGRLMWKKDFGTMLEAMARVRSGILLIAGTGVLEKHLRNLAEELRANVRFLGERHDVAALMSAADGLLLSSVVEGLPMVLLEAAAAGLPCVATDTGGVSEVVRDSQTGFLVPPREPVPFANAMERLSAMPAAARATMGRAAREHATAHFDLRTTAAAYDRLYRELLESAGRRSQEWT